jgi:hypothetical protein
LDVGETIDLVFGAPQGEPDGGRHYILQTAGYYLLFAGKLPGGRAPDGLPAAFRLRAASPNPVSSWTRLRFELPRTTHVRLNVYDVSGRAVATLLDETRPAGYHAAIGDGRGSDGRTVSAGHYFARMEAGGESQTEKFVFIK